ncbi:MAG: hypothetical protein GX451_02110 [Acholeplasmataceae bacterium]|nr:hypothetical protein [Acholeplasmataceae bacterium]
MLLYHLGIPYDAKFKVSEIEEAIEELEAKGELTIQSIAEVIVSREERMLTKINSVILQNNQSIMSEIDMMKKKLK